MCMGWRGVCGGRCVCGGVWGCVFNVNVSCERGGKGGRAYSQVSVIENPGKVEKSILC